MWTYLLVNVGDRSLNLGFNLRCVSGNGVQRSWNGLAVSCRFGCCHIRMYLEQVIDFGGLQKALWYISAAGASRRHGAEGQLGRRYERGRRRVGDWWQRRHQTAVRRTKPRGYRGSQVNSPSLLCLSECWSPARNQVAFICLDVVAARPGAFGFWNHAWPLVDLFRSHNSFLRRNTQFIYWKENLWLWEGRHCNYLLGQLCLTWSIALLVWVSLHSGTSSTEKGTLYTLIALSSKSHASFQAKISLLFRCWKLPKKHGNVADPSATSAAVFFGDGRTTNWSLDPGGTWMSKVKGLKCPPENKSGSVPCTQAPKRIEVLFWKCWVYDLRGFSVQWLICCCALPQEAQSATFADPWSQNTERTVGENHSGLQLLRLIFMHRSQLI